MMNKSHLETVAKDESESYSLEKLPPKVGADLASMVVRDSHGTRAKPVKSQRSIRRLFTRFDLDRLGEIPNIAALRQDLRELLSDVTSSAEEDGKSADKLQIFLSDNRGQLIGIDADLAALEKAKAQTEALRKGMGPEATLESFVQLLGPIQEAVAQEWATVFMRLRRPVIHALIAAVVGLALYFAVSAWIPSMIFAALVLICPSVSFGSVYWFAVSRMRRQIRRAKASLNALDPDAFNASLGSDDLSLGSFWTTGDPSKVLARLLARLTFKSATRAGWVPLISRQVLKPVTSFASVLVFSAVIPTLVVVGAGTAVWFYALQAPQQQVVLRTGSETSCVLETGSVLWPGPFDIILLHAGTPVVIRRAQTLLLRRDGAALPSCQGSPQIRSVSSGGSPFPTIIALFNKEHIKDAGSAKLSVSPGTQEQLMLIRNWIKRCQATVDVKGLASAADFRGTSTEVSNQQNLLLAEHRRQKILTVLQINDVSRRFTTHEEMMAANPFRALDSPLFKTLESDVTEQMARIGLIEIKNLGSCASLPKVP